MQPIDVHATLQFTTLRRDLIFLAIFAGVMPFAAWREAWLIVAICVPGTLFMLWRVIMARPALVLMPEGIHYDYDGIRFFIPWIVLENVATRDLATRDAVFKNTIMLTIPRGYYAAHVHTRHGKLLNPSSDAYFIPDGDKVEVALYPQILRVGEPRLRAEIEARWRSFGVPDAPEMERNAP